MRTKNYRKDTSNWEAIKKRLRADKGGNAKVGFMSDRYGDENENLPVAYVAQLNNEGIGNPHRPFFYHAMQNFVENKNTKRVAADLVGAIAAGGMTKQKAVTTLGKFLKSEIEMSIDNWTEPPNSAKTIDAKGRDDPLRDSFKMVDSVRVEYSQRRR